MDTIIREAVQKYGNAREDLLSVMQYVVAKGDWLKEESLEMIANEFDMSAAEVYGVATFYSFLDTKPRGKYIIKLCKTISCDMAGKQQILDALKNTLSIEVGETTPDKMFTLVQTNCIGWCHKGPAMLINDTVYTELTPQMTVDIIHKYIENEKN